MPKSKEIMGSYCVVQRQEGSFIHHIYYTVTHMIYKSIVQYLEAHTESGGGDIPPAPPLSIKYIIF